MISARNRFFGLGFGVLAFVIAAVGHNTFANNAFADDEADAQAAFREAQTYFSEREDGQKASMAVISAQRAIKLTQDDDLKYQAWILVSRSYYWKGTHVPTDDEKMKWHDEGMKAAKTAYELNDDYADGFYYYAVNLGRWALAKGVLASLRRKDELIQHAKEAIDRTTFDGAEGETMDGFGPHRTLGRMYFKLPGFAGGSRTQALTHLEKAFDQAPQLVLNTVYLAEVLSDGNSAEKARARKILDEILVKDPASLDPARIPESREELMEAKKLRDSI